MSIWLRPSAARARCRGVALRPLVARAALLAIVAGGFIWWASGLRAEEPILVETWDYATPMQEVAAQFRGRQGVVLHIGDSITYSNPYGQWARSGKEQTAEDQATLRWMHVGEDDDRDGYWLARFDHPDGGRSHTAASGLRADELLAGGKRGLPRLKDLLDYYAPQIVVLMIGTNDATAERKVADYRADLDRAVQQILSARAICILSTIPPHYHSPDLAQEYNQAVRGVAADRRLPLIDFEREILTRRRDDWNGTLLGKDDVHPTAQVGDVSAASAPTKENLRTSGYLLRGWLSVRKISEVKARVIDKLPGEVIPPDGDANPMPLQPPMQQRPPMPQRPLTPQRPWMPLQPPDLPRRRADQPVVAAPGVVDRAHVLTLPVTRDGWFSEVGNEADANLGGSPKLKFKSYQEFSLVDCDLTGVGKRAIRRATLHLKQASPERLHRVTVSSIAVEWIEGSSARYAPEAGASSFRRRVAPDEPWEKGAADITSVILGNGHSVWRMADATPPDKDGWQQIPVDPRLIALRARGYSHGFIVFDDTGSEWTRDGETFTLRPFPNRFFHSRNSKPQDAPYFTIELGAEDLLPPLPVEHIESDFTDLPAGQTRLKWQTSEDRGPSGVIGYQVSAPGNSYFVPGPVAAGRTATVLVTGLNHAGDPIFVSIRAVDGAGNISRATSATAPISGRGPKDLPPVVEPPKHAAAAALPKLGEAAVAIVDTLDKFHPTTGEGIPPRDKSYLAANHLWDAGSRTIRLAVAKNEIISFQIFVQGTTRGVIPKVTWPAVQAVQPAVEFRRYRYVATKLGPLPDPLVPLGDRGLVIPAPDEKIAGQSNGSLLCELVIPHAAPTGVLRGTLVLTENGQELALPIEITVHDFTLPDYLSFLPEMNCYGLPKNERDYYRLAQRHRTVLNRVPYSQAGRVADGCAPQWDGKTFDWKEWDVRFGPLFDGSAFADLPRGPVPIECFYLPLHENWPTPMEGQYNGDYWADRAFPPAYRAAMVAASKAFAEHCHTQRWHNTLFHFYLNGKNNFKQQGWSRGSSPWLLDEPAHFQDFWALRYFAEAFHEGVNQTPGRAKMVFRADLSRPQWQRDALDGLLDYNVVAGGPFRRYGDLVLARKDRFGEIVNEYGSTNAIEASNVQAAGWCLDAWCRGADGVLPWQTVGRGESWQQGDPLALFYPGESIGLSGPIPSVRLKAYLRGQQAVEYLTVWSHHFAEPRVFVGRRVRERLRLVAERTGTGFTGGEDAGLIQFNDLRPEAIDALCRAFGAALSRERPPAVKQIIDFRPPRRDPQTAPPGYVTGYEPGK